MMLAHTKKIHEKNGPNSLDFFPPKSKILQWFPARSQEYKRILFVFLLSYIVFSQIWPTYFLMIATLNTSQSLQKNRWGVRF
jgi:hypothetical protein